MKLAYALVSLALLSCSYRTNTAPIKNTIQIMSDDGIKIYADTYFENNDSLKPIILLCHQAGYSRGEYLEIAPRLNSLGIDCIAIDQRSGSEINGIKNETARQAKQKNLPVDYISAKADISTAVDFLFYTYHRKIIVWGSSYSATLALHIANEKNNVAACVAFSPGEYFENPNYLKQALDSMHKPCFITSAQNESLEIQSLLPKNKRTITQFIPNVEGKHGSSALWKNTTGNADYWEALEIFLRQEKFIE